MKTSIIVLPYKILAHTCEKVNCSHDQLKVDLKVEGIRVSIHPFFTTGEEHHSAFPKLIQKDIPFFASNKDEEVPALTIKQTYLNTKEVNAFHIDYIDGEIIDSVELSIVDGLLRHFKVLSNQYWINSPIKQLQRK